MKKVVDGNSVSVKDDNGSYLPPYLVKKPEAPKEIQDISIDTLMSRAFRTIHGIIRAIEVDVASGAPSRETIMNLKDIMAMLKDLKKEEKDFLESLSDDELVKLNKDAHSK